MNAERLFDTSNYDKKDNRPLPIGKNNDTEHKKAKGTKKCIVKREIIFENYKDGLFDDKVIIKSQQRFRSYNHKVYTEEVNKIALSSNDDKRIQT